MESSPALVISVPPKEAEDPYEIMGSSVMVAWLIWHATLGEAYINMLTCMLSIVGLELDPMTDDHLALALQELSNSD